MRQTEELLTVKEAADLTKRKVSTWRKDIQLRRIGYVRLGPRQVRIPRSEIDRLIKEGWREPVTLQTERNGG